MNLIISILASILISHTAFAHGEDKPGPNGGHIRMPGSFHTEVVTEKNGNFKIYLLDLEFKNPTLKNSKVDVKIIQGSKSTQVKCTEKEIYFSCTNTLGLKSGQLSIEATRDNAKASMKADYELPLKHLHH